MNSCRSCRREVPPEAKVCIKCGADLRPSKALWFLTFGSVLVAGTAAYTTVPPEGLGRAAEITMARILET